MNVRITSRTGVPSGWRSDLDFEVLDSALVVRSVAISGSDNETLYLHNVASGWYYVFIGYSSTGYADCSNCVRYAITLETGTTFGVG